MVHPHLGHRLLLDAERPTGFTPADFALVAQGSAQRAFDRALSGGAPEVTPDDVREAVAATRPSVTKEAEARLSTESQNYARL